MLSFLFFTIIFVLFLALRRRTTRRSQKMKRVCEFFFFFNSRFLGILYLFVCFVQPLEVALQQTVAGIYGLVVCPQLPERLI